MQAEEHPGFTDALLDILQAEQEAPVRMSSMQNLRTPLPRCLHILTDHCSRCLPQEPHYKRMVTERGLPAEQTYT
jgi:hypothetical protein